ncbi:MULTISPECIES: sensor histidine kinase [unclassified Pseudofrankia]|uniref:sensor histidine kinase n=1 Tax=unclassified Pseudofrankia TaxID=2994372 RepID=UPI0008DAC142|nr:MULTISPECIES: sensor histidine kinase [unclassified Pseudofrankia]MDT3445715.1 sensor histidine kinase [Pseudofrankia sp. BMG5.37]OHV42477.1 histidine kinase [Pseudofrankia sp. BMG5.36]
MANRTTPPPWTPPGNAPKRFRGPFARWPRAADAVLTLAAFFMTVFVVDGPGDSMSVRPIGDVPFPVLLVVAVAGPVLYWRRRAPLIVLGVALTAWAVLLASHDAAPGWHTILALYATGRYAAADWRGPAGIAAGTALASVDGLDDPGPWWQVPVIGSVVMFGAWYIGRRVRLRQDRVVQLQRDRAAETRRIVAEERTRIARELHDVVAHRVSLMTIQASGARAVAVEDPQAALRAMGAVEEAGRQALDELRHLLGVLRPESDLGELRPQPSLADLPRLIEQVRRAGADVTLATGGLPAGLPARTDLFAYRIIQEALTNVLKHAGPGAPTKVWLRTDRNRVVIEVHDDGHGTAAMPGQDVVQDGSGGHGIIGMRERALLLGGSLEAGPYAGGGFRVVAHLPIGGEPA